MVSRPSETLSAALGTLVLAVVSVLEALDIEVPVAYVTAATAVVGFVAAAVTWYVARQQRDPARPLSSGKDGTVVE